MASKSERTIINAAGLVQGIVMVTFPAACTIFTDKSQYGLSSTQYGRCSCPRSRLALAASLLSAGLARQTARRDGRQSLLYGHATADRFQAEAAATYGGQELSADASLFTAYLQAERPGTPCADYDHRGRAGPGRLHDFRRGDLAQGPNPKA